jgi:hypothetical protein
LIEGELFVSRAPGIPHQAFLTISKWLSVSISKSIRLG